MKIRISGFIGILATTVAVASSVGCQRGKADVEEENAIDVARAEETAVEAVKSVDVERLADASTAAIEMPVQPAFTGEVSVVINKTIQIKRAKVDEMVDAMLSAGGGMIPEEQREQAKAYFRPQVIQQLTVQTVLTLAADKAGIQTTAEDEKAFFTKITDGREVTKADFAKQTGMTEAKLDEMLAIHCRIDKLMEQQLKGLPTLTEADAKAKFDEIVAENPDAVKVPETVSASHILVSLKDTAKETEEAAKAKIEGYRAQLLAGTNFAELASRVSDCPSKARGGNLGKFGRGQMVPEFDAAAFSQKVGEIGEVVKTSFGYHIIVVDSKEAAHELVFDDVKDQILNGMKLEAETRVKNEFVMNLMDAAQIENLEEAVTSEPVQADVEAEAEVEADAEAKAKEVQAEVKAEEVKAEVKTEEVKAEAKAEEVQAEVKAEEVQAEVKAEEVKAEVKTEEVKAEVKAEEVQAEVKAEEVKAEAAK